MRLNTARSGRRGLPLRGVRYLRQAFRVRVASSRFASCSQAESTPASAPVTQTVRRLQRLISRLLLLYMLHIRPFHQQDWEILLELANQAVPFAPKENLEWLEYRKAFDESSHIRRHYIAQVDNRPIGYGCLEQQEDDLKSLRIYVVCNPAHLQDEVGEQLYLKLWEEAKQLGAIRLWAREFQNDEPIREFFTRQGFIETQRYTPPNFSPLSIFQLDL
jgi:N-acetylglutamate synthase-like GNAT family acetyltransferase